MLAATRPDALVTAGAAHGLEQQLIHAVVECLAGGSADKSIRPGRWHQDTMVRIEYLLRSQPDRAPPVSEICAALGVSERLLRNLSTEHLGMSPTRYGRLRRLSQVRSMLRRGAADATSVSEVARRNGFLDLGRFAADYRAAFGECPAVTLLRRGVDGRMVAVGSPWTRDRE